jgi:hypothetical protein
MANGVSGQNFLNLLFGGAQQGVNEFRRQQGQQTDLMLTLQNMLAQRASEMRRQVEADRSFGLQQEQLGLQKQQLGDQRAEAVRQRYVDDWKMRQAALQQGLDRRRQGVLDQARLDLMRAQTKATGALANKRVSDEVEKFTPGQVIQLEREYKKRKAEAKQMKVLRENAPEKYRDMFSYEEPPATFEEFLDQMRALALEGGPRAGLAPAAGVSGMTDEQLLEALLGSE